MRCKSVTIYVSLNSESDQEYFSRYCVLTGTVRNRYMEEHGSYFFGFMTEKRFLPF